MKKYNNGGRIFMSTLMTAGIMLALTACGSKAENANVNLMIVITTFMGICRKRNHEQKRAVQGLFKIVIEVFTSKCYNTQSFKQIIF